MLILLPSFAKKMIMIWYQNDADWQHEWTITLWVAAKQFHPHADSSRMIADGNEADTTSDHRRSQFAHLSYVRVDVTSQCLLVQNTRTHTQLRQTKALPENVTVQLFIIRLLVDLSQVSAASIWVTLVYYRLLTDYTQQRWVITAARVRNCVINAR